MGIYNGMGLFWVASTWLLFYISAQASPLTPVELTHTLPEIQLQPRLVAEDCKLWAATDLWATCQSFTKHYNITVPNLLKMNPSIESDCSGFKPGDKYCLRMPTSFPKSTDGSCGRQASKNVTCIGSGFGDCCGKTGSCGSTDEFCAIGNCQSGICPGLGYSTDGNCGKDFGNLMCGGPYGKCCSKAGKCGSTTTECGKENCQSGDCEGTPTTTTSITTEPTALPSPGSPSPDGTCGYVNKYVCTGTKYYYGNCCSAAGYCGATEYHCKDILGCQSEFGLCDKSVIVTLTSDEGTKPTSSA